MRREIAKEVLVGYSSTGDSYEEKEGKKKAGVFVYEVSEEVVEDYPSIYFYLLDSQSSDLTLKMKKALMHIDQILDYKFGIV